MMLQQRLQKISDWMPSQIPRNISNPQPPLRQSLVRMSNHLKSMRLNMRVRPRAALRSNQRIVISASIKQRQNQIAVRIRITGLQLQGPLVGGNRVIKLCAPSNALPRLFCARAELGIRTIAR